MLRLDYMAWIPQAKPKTAKDRTAIATQSWRSGITKAGHTHKHKKVKGEPRSVRIHIAFDPPLVAPPGSTAGVYGFPEVVATMCGEPGQSFPDVHGIVVHDVDAFGFNATVMRVDSLGHGWMSNIVVHWLAWLPRLPVAPMLVHAPSEQKAETAEKVSVAAADQKKKDTAAEKGKAANVTTLRGPEPTTTAKAIPPAKAPAAMEKEKAASDSVSTRPSLSAPSQVVHVFANTTPPTPGDEPVVHVHAPLASTPPTATQPDFDHLPEITDPKEAVAAAAPGFTAAAKIEQKWVEQKWVEQKWDFVATTPGTAERDEAAAGGLATHGTSHGGKRRQALSVSD